MKAFMKRVRSRRGETLVESLVSILIFTLASILLLSMAASATRINATVREEDLAFQQRQAAIEQPSGSAVQSTFAISAGSTSLGSVTANVVTEGGITAVIPTQPTEGGAE